MSGKRGMKNTYRRAALIGFLAGASAFAQTGALVDRVGNTGFLQLRAESFRSLARGQKELAYWLVQASIAIDPIIYDQLSAFGIREKRLLEEIASHPPGIDPAALKKITDFAKLFWANRGNHNENTSQKILPDFTIEDLQKAADQAFKNGAFRSTYGDLPALSSPQQVNKEVLELKDALFNPEFEPMITAKSPRAGKDIVQASSNTFYGPGVTLADLANFKEHYPLDSTVVKDKNGRLSEQVWRAGTPNGSVPPGKYAVYLKKAIECLQKALTAAEPQQAKVIGDLIHFYQTGEPADWLTFGADWVRNNATVDFANGFIEVYRDARGAKGSSQSFVTVTDKPLTDTMNKLANNAAYFEEKAPWLDAYKKKSFTPPVVKAVEVLIETGDFQVSTIGDNLPNENEIHEKYGTKNFLFTASSRAFDEASGHKSIREFGATPEIIERDIKYGQQAEELLTALHEVIGHGSGKLSARLIGGAEPFLKEYFSTLEEARADLSAYWNVWDPKLKDLGLVQNQDEVAKAMYDGAASTMLQQLRRIPKGDTIEEDHQRDRALIANYIMATTGAIKMITRNGKTYVMVDDYMKMHQAAGKLLAELMRIKAEGDYNAIKLLVDKYAVHFDPKLRDQVVARYKALDIPTYWAGINPQLTATLGNDGGVRSVDMTYPRDAIHQYLLYGSMFDPGLKASAR
jgi:dipeptidyl-peptidase III